MGLSYSCPTIACKLPLNRPLPKAIKNKATQVRVNNHVLFSGVERIGIASRAYPAVMIIRPLMIVPL